MARHSPCSLGCWASREDREEERRQRREEWQASLLPQEATRSRSGAESLRASRRLERWQSATENMVESALQQGQTPTELEPNGKTC